MGRKVNVVTDTGKVVSVDESEATRLDRAATTAVTEQAAERLNEEASSGVIEGGKAFVEGVADGATLGGYGKLRQMASDSLGDAAARDMAVRAQHNKGARIAGEIASVIAPTGLLGKGAAVVGKVTGAGLAARAGAQVAKVGGKYAGLATEAGILGAGSHIASTNVTGDPLSVESVVSSAGVGAILGVGLGAIGGAIGRVGKRAVAAKEAAKIEQKAAQAIDDFELPAYREFRAAHEAAEGAAKAANKEVEAAKKAYDGFAGKAGSPGKGLSTAIKQSQGAIDDIRAQLSAKSSALRTAPATPATGAELDAVNRTLADLAPAHKKLTVIADGAAANPAEAVESLRAFHAEIAPLGVTVPALPAAPGALKPVTGVKLPDTVRGFGRMHVDSVAKVANSLGDEGAASIGKVADSLGLARGANPAETVAAIQRSVRSVTGPGGGGKETLVDVLRQGAGGAIGGLFGGPVGAVLGTMVGGTGGSGVVSGKLGQMFVAGKMGAVQRITALIAKASPVASRIGTVTTKAKLPVVTSVLSDSFPDLHPDPEKDLSKRALNRINEISATSVGVNDAAYMAVQGLLGQPDDLAVKVANHLSNAVSHLAATLPAPSTTNTRMGTSDWSPQYHEALMLSYRLEAVQNPDQAIERALQGDSHPAAIDTLWAVYPALMTELASQVAASPEMQNATYSEASRWSLLFRTPMSGLQTPEVIAAIQSKYLPPLPPERGQGSAAKSPQVNGRPAAIQSPVAGSSVAGLTSQR